MEELTDKQKRFAEEYLIDLNATQAAARAGYSDTSYGRQLLTFSHVLNYVETLQKERSDRTKISADKVLQEMAKLGFSDITRYVNADWTIKSIDQIPPEETAAILSIKTTVDESLSLDGKSINRRTKVEFKLHPKLQPLHLLGQHLGMFNEKTPAGTLPPILDKDETEH